MEKSRMHELYNLTAADVVGYIADDVVKNKGISKSLARKLVINALIYNCVTEVVYEQVEFLMGEDDDDI